MSIFNRIIPNFPGAHNGVYIETNTPFGAEMFAVGADDDLHGELVADVTAAYIIHDKPLPPDLEWSDWLETVEAVAAINEYGDDYEVVAMLDIATLQWRPVA